MISAMCVCALWVRALRISVFWCFGPFVAEVGPRTSLNGLGSKFPAEIKGRCLRGSGLRPFWGVGDRPGGPSCVIRKNNLCVPQRSLKSRQKMLRSPAPPTGSVEGELRVSLAILNWILAPGPGPEPSQIRSRMAGIGPLGPGERLDFYRACRRLGPRTGRPRWGTTSATLRVPR